MIDTAVCRPSCACQRPMPARLVILENRQLSWSDVYGVAVLVAEHEVVVAPGGADCPAFPGLPLRVSSERDDRALRQFERALRLRRLGVAALARRAPDVDHSPIEVYVIPRELAQLAGAQAEGNQDDEQRLEPAVSFIAVV